MACSPTQRSYHPRGCSHLSIRLAAHARTATTHLLLHNIMARLMRKAHIALVRSPVVQPSARAVDGAAILCRSRCDLGGRRQR